MKPLGQPILKATLIATALATALAVSLPAEAQPYPYSTKNELRFRGGVFDPSGGSGYWDDSFRDFTGSTDDFQGGAFGMDYLHEIAPLLDVMVGGSYYFAEHDLAYRNFEDERGRSILHTTRIETASFDAGLVLHLAPRHAPIVPYIGGGGTAVNYRLEEVGDFVDFGANPPSIFRSSFSAHDVAFGWFALAGVDVPIGRTFSVFAEGRYQDAHDNLSDDFEGFGRLNLTGTYVTFGGSWKF